jgi:histidinol-phosphate aminotransferase
VEDFRPPVRDDLAGIEPYGAPQLNVDVRLNVNENPFPPSVEFAQDIARSVERAAREMNRYPDRDFRQLRADLADYLAMESQVRVSADEIWAANGSNEVMAHVLAAFGGPGRRVVSFPPTYSMYPEYARESFTELIEVPRAADFTVDMASALATIEAAEPSVILVAAPNNPTGTAISLTDLGRLAAAVRDVGGVAVIDEAYAEFRPAGTPSALELLPDHPNVIVSRTMSKAFAMAGARIGYAAAHPTIIDALRIVRLPYHLSVVSQAVARVALSHAEELQSGLQVLRQERDALVQALADRGLQVAPSAANFCLFGRFRDRHQVWQRLVDRGVLIRETGPEGWLRVSVGTIA